MKTLLVDTCAGVASLAVADGQRLLAACQLPEPRSHSLQLVPAIAAALAEAGLVPADLQLLAVTVGPGSFTGVRVGVATVKALSLALGLPIVPLSSLAVLALQAPDAMRPVVPLLDARKGEVYAGRYRLAAGLAEPLAADGVLPPAELAAQLAASGAPWLLLGDGALRYRELFAACCPAAEIVAPAPSPGGVALALPLVLELARRGQALPHHLLLPTYLRPSEAETARLATVAP